MRRQAKASSAGSTTRQVGGLGRIFRGAFVVPGAVDSGGGSSAPRLPFALAVTCLGILLLAPVAHAGKVEGFGVLGTGQNGAGAGYLGSVSSDGVVQGLAVNPAGSGGAAAGDVYVTDTGNNRVSQFHGDGEFVQAFGVGVASGATGTGTLTGSALITEVVTTSKAFTVGQTIASGSEIPPGTVITAVGNGTITLSKAATASGALKPLISDAGPGNVPINEIQMVTLPGAAVSGNFKLAFSTPNPSPSTAAANTTANLPFNATPTEVQSALEALGNVGPGGVVVTSPNPGGGAVAGGPYSVEFTGTRFADTNVNQMTAPAGSPALSSGSASVSTAIQGATAAEVCTVSCVAGVATAAAGGLREAKGIAVDPATGNVFVVSSTDRRINVYSPDGQFQGAFGWNVDAASPESVLQFCTTATGCAQGTSGAGAGQFGVMAGNSGQGASLTVSPVNGHLFVAQPGNRRIDEFSLSLNGADEVTGVSYVKGFGGDVAPTINEKQTVTVADATGGSFSLIFSGKSTDATGTGDVAAGSNEITNFKATGGTFVIGEEVSGPGIPAGTRITAATFDSLTLSAPATASAVGASVSATLAFDSSASTVQGALRGLSTVGGGNVVVSGPAISGGERTYTVEFTGQLAGSDVAELSGDATNLTGSGAGLSITTTRTGSGGTGTGFETCDVATTCQVGKEGNGRNGTFRTNTPTSVAIDSFGSVYATGEPRNESVDSTGSPSKCAPCTVQKFSPDATSAEEFAPEQLTPPDGVDAGTFSPMRVAIDPTNDHVIVVKRVSRSPNEVKLYEFTRAGGLIDVSPVGDAAIPAAGNPVVIFGPQGFAVGTEQRAYLAQYQGPVKILSQPPAPQASIDPVGEIDASSAVLSGIARPSAPGIEGGFPTAAYFEYSSDGLIWQSTEPIEIGTGAGAGSANSCPSGNPPVCNVSAKIFGLSAGTGYVARLVVSNGTRAISETTSFTTPAAPPKISGSRAVPVTKTTANLTGMVNPNGKSTTYYFEWGPSTSYGNRIPQEFDGAIGAGSKDIKVNAKVGSLAPNATYHFRIVASSDSGTSVGPDVEFRTLNAAGLPADRGIELVSPADKRPAGSVEIALRVSGSQLFFQAARSGEAVAFPILNAYGDSESGGEVIFAGSRSDSGWQTTQLTPPSLIPSPEPGLLGLGRAGAVRYMDPANLDCAIVETHNPLTADTPPASVATGVYNLYRWDRSSGDYTLLSQGVPLNTDATSVSNLYYEVIGATADCSRVFFRSTTYRFSSAASGFYEWHDGVLSDVGLRPDGSIAPSLIRLGHQKYSVGSNGNIFFSAQSNAGNTAGKTAVFARKADGEVLDVSLSQTAVTPQGALFQAASPDGIHVYFLANYGLTSESSAGPTTANCSTVTKEHQLACDLYDFNLNTQELSNISADSNPADTNGSVTQGILDISEDGSTVYFAARGQLVPGLGRTYKQNLLGSGFANVYKWRDNELSFVGSLTSADMQTNTAAAQASSALIQASESWDAQTNKSGSHLLFTSHDNMTGSNRTGVAQAYLYSAATGATDCISCPADGSQPAPEGPRIIQGPRNGAAFGNYTPTSLTDDGRAFFTTLDALTPDAVRGEDTSRAESENNIYEWNRGQVSLLASGPARLVDVAGPDGRDVYVVSYDQLDFRDFDNAADLYDFRVGGGFSPPGVAGPGCQVNEAVPLEANQIYCQGDAGAQPTRPAQSSSGFTSQGNVDEGTQGRRRCVPLARQARRLSRKAKKLRRRAVRVANPRANGRLSRRARGTARRARAKSGAAKRCRVAARAANTNHGGAK